jgi:phytoene dehydrogenase-like protein
MKSGKRGKEMEKAIIVIGAGIAGLSAGIYGRMNGYRTKIFEMGAGPGGVCTGWRRGGYTVDGCVHWLTGSAEGNCFYPLWKEVGAIQGRVFLDHEEYSRVEGKEGKVLIVYSDIDRLERHMKELSPADSAEIGRFADGVRTCLDFPMPVEKAPELFGPRDGMAIGRRMLPFLPFLRAWAGLSVTDFAARLKDPFLREAFPRIPNLQTPAEFPMMALFMTLAWMHRKVAGYPVGGSLALAEAMERRYLSLGGEIRYGARIGKILVEKGRAVGVRLSDGGEVRGDAVISAADGRSTIFGMLDGKFLDRRIRGYYEKLPIYQPLVYVGLGVDMGFDGLPGSVTGTDFPLERPINVGGVLRDRMSALIYSFDPSLAPAGKTLIRVMYKSDYDYWMDASRDPVKYREEKARIAEDIVGALDARYPGLAARVEMRDVATPLTFERYTGNWRGSFQGWLITKRTVMMRMGKTLPGLKDFYMAGQWVEPGGSLPTALMSGRNVIQMVCHGDGRSFSTSQA